MTLPSARIDELLACPFCDNAPVIEGTTIKCMTKDCWGPIVENYGNLSDAIAAWNRRSPRPDEGKAEPVAWPADDTALAQMCEDFQTGSVGFANEPEEFHHLIEFTPPMLREFVARHPPYASPLPVEAGEPVGLPQDVIDLVIEARNVAYSDQSPEAIRALDKSVEAFAERVGWEDDPTPLEAEDRP